MASSMNGRWTCIPERKTASAHARSSARAAPAFSSTKRTSQDSGRYAATTSRPWGGMKARMRPPKSGYE